MVDPNKLALLEAAAQGGTAGLKAAQEAQTQQAPTGAISGALSAAIGQQGLTGEAVTQLQGMENRPAEVMAARGTATLGANNAYLYDLARARNAFMDFQESQVLPSIARKLALEEADGGGSGGGGGRSGGGGGGGGRGGSSKSKGSKSNEYKLGDWLEAAREDAGLVGTGIRSKTGLPPFLQGKSLEGAKANAGTELGALALAMPRDLRARAWAESEYGATPEDIDKGAPVSGFLEDALVELQSAIDNNIKFERYRKDTRKAAQGLKGNQKKAVQYVLNLARQNLPGSPGTGIGAFAAATPAETPQQKAIVNALSKIKLF